MNDHTMSNLISETYIYYVGGIVVPAGGLGVSPINPEDRRVRFLDDTTGTQLKQLDNSK